VLTTPGPHSGAAVTNAINTSATVGIHLRIMALKTRD
jgi:hypothetical protein